MNRTGEGIEDFRRYSPRTRSDVFAALTAGTALLLLVLLSCSKPKIPDPVQDYPGFVRANANILCAKMLKCYRKIYFSVSPEMQKRITHESCMKAALGNLDAKLRRHTPAMKQLSVQCYATLRAEPCKTISLRSLWDPACLSLRRMTQEALRKEALAEKTPRPKAKGK